MKTGFSIYLSTGIEKNEEVIHKVKNAGASYGFTSLHIPEEDYDDYKNKVKELLTITKQAGIELTMDVDDETPERLGVKRMEDLIDYGVTSIRLDYGFSDEDIVALSKNFNIVWNASTVNPFEIHKWEKMGADVDKFTACHNYYPKPYTGLSLENVRDINDRLKMAGYSVAAFIPGNEIFRGPLHLGLPTIEDHRNSKDHVAINMLELYQANTDIVMVGDVDLSENGWRQFKDMSDGVVRLHANFFANSDEIIGRINHDRPDSSPYVIRSVESREWFTDKTILPQNCVNCEAGTICISNDYYLRYKGELEICRKPRIADKRINIIGKIVEEDLQYLPYIKSGMGFVLEPIVR